MTTDSMGGPVLLGPRRQQLSEEVAAYVRELIISGAVRAGDFLRMDRIAEAVGVSNTPVREGLLTLASQGFVRQIPRRGFVVAQFGPQDIRDLFWAQAFLAGELAARAAMKISRGQVARLEHIDAAFHDAAAVEDHRTVDGLGHAFHREINLAADSIRLAMLLGSVVRTLPLQFYSSIEGGIDASSHDHPAIIAALRKREASNTRHLMARHISGVGDHLIATLEQRGLWSGSKAS